MFIQLNSPTIQLGHGNDSGTYFIGANNK